MTRRKAPPIILADYVPYYFGTIANRWTASSSRIYREQFGVGIGDWRVIASLRALGEASAQQIVALTFMDAGAVSRSMRSLEEDGKIAPVEGRFAGRTKPFKLTKSGEALYAEINRIALKREEALLAGLDAEERAELRRLMARMLENLDDL